MSTFKSPAKQAATVLPVLLVMALQIHSAYAANPAPAAVAAPAAADDTATPASQKGIEQVMVTAERRRVNLQDAPLAVTALSGDALAKSNVVNLAGLNGQVPGLSIAKSSGYETVVTVRGVGSETPEAALQTQPGVSLHVDGVYIANSISLDQSLFDLDHIEVLRGPQGTVSGMASTGGTINLISKQPELGKFGGSADVSLGNYSLSQERAALNIPLGETAALRVSAQKFDHDGFTKSTYGFDLDEAHDYSGKLAFMWKPTRDFTATLTGQWYRANQNGAAQKNIVDPNTDPRTVTQDYMSKFKLSADLYHLNLEYVMDKVTLKSITSFQKMYNHIQQNGSRLDFATLGQFDDVASWNTTVSNYTQEFDLVSNPGGVIDWQSGVFFMHQNASQYVVEYGGSVANPVFVMPSRPLTVRPQYLTYLSDSTVVRESYAAFTQATYHATDALRLTAGVRYNHDHNVGGTKNSLGTNGKLPTGKLEADYDLSKHNMLYASLTRGYKPNGANPNPGALLTPHYFQQETVNAFEFGSKNTFMDNKLRVNVAAFYYDYRNMQYLEVDPYPYLGGISNIPKVHMKGIEGEVSYLALENRLRTNANLTLMQGKIVGDYYTLDAAGVAAAVAKTPGCGSYYSSYPTTACAIAVGKQSQNLNGNSTAKTPKVQGSVNVAYAMPLESGIVTPRIEVIYRGKFNYRVFANSTLDMVPAYTIANLHVDYAPNNSNWNFALTLSNIADKAGINSRYTDPYGIKQTSNEYIAPRQIIAQVAYQF